MGVKILTINRFRLGVVIGLLACLVLGPLQAEAVYKAPYLGAVKRPVCGAKPIRSVKTTQKVVAMTFDDGPSPYHTQAVVNNLAKYGAKGTFYMVGTMVDRYPALTNWVYTRGHELGIHSRTHSYTPSVIASEIGPSGRDVYDATGKGVYVWTFRSPGLTKSYLIDQKVAYYKLCNVFTDYDLRDWVSPRISSWQICQNFKRALHPGYVALLHDGGSNHGNTVNALPCMLSYARSMGYKFVTVSQMLNMGTHVPYW